MLKSEQVDGLLASMPVVDMSEFPPELRDKLAVAAASLAALSDALRED